MTSEPQIARFVAPVDLEPIATLIRRIVERLDPEEIWLLGSRAEGRGRPDSDYDLQSG